IRCVESASRVKVSADASRPVSLARTFANGKVRRRRRPTICLRAAAPPSLDAPGMSLIAGSGSSRPCGGRLARAYYLLGSSISEITPMTVRWVRRAVELMAFVALITGPMATRTQGADDFATLRAQVSKLYDDGKYSDAIPIAERYVDLARQKYG